MRHQCVGSGCTLVRIGLPRAGEWAAWTLSSRPSTRIATIPADDHYMQEFRASVDTLWTVLSDPDQPVQKDLDIQEYTDPEHNPMMLGNSPHLQRLLVFGAARPSSTSGTTRAVTSEICRDWDLSAPGLREAWNAGDFSPTYGWNKSAKAGPVGRKDER